MVRQYEFGPLVPEGWMTSTQKVRADMTPHLRGAIIRRDRGLCRYCGCKPEHIEIDHVKPVVRGGQSTMENCVTACRSCNQRKGWSLKWTPIPLDEMRSVAKQPRRTKIKVKNKHRAVPKQSKRDSKTKRREELYGENRVFRYTGR